MLLSFSATPLAAAFHERSRRSAAALYGEIDSGAACVMCSNARQARERGNTRREARQCCGGQEERGECGAVVQGRRRQERRGIYEYAAGEEMRRRQTRCVMMIRDSRQRRCEWQAEVVRRSAGVATTPPSSASPPSLSLPLISRHRCRRCRRLRRRAAACRQHAAPPRPHAICLRSALMIR